MRASKKEKPKVGPLVHITHSEPVIHCLLHIVIEEEVREMSL